MHEISPADIDSNTIGHRIRAARKALNLNQESLASRLGVSQPTVANWEADAHNPRQLMLAKLAEALGVSLGWLAGGEAVDRAGKNHPAVAYVARPIVHVPVLPTHLLIDRRLLEDRTLHAAAIDFVPVISRSATLFAAFIDPRPYVAMFPGETLFIFDYQRTDHVAGVYLLLGEPHGPRLFLAGNQDGRPRRADQGVALGTLSLSVRIF